MAVLHRFSSHEVFGGSSSKRRQKLSMGELVLLAFSLKGEIITRIVFLVLVTLIAKYTTSPF